MKKILSVIFSILIVSGLVYAASNLARRYPSDTPMEVLTPDSISNTAYGISWSTVTDVAPSQKALYDKIETLGGGHDAVTLDVNADTILELTGQEVGLDDQDANKVFSGPTTGEADTPAFRSLVAEDIPDLSGTYLTAESDPLSATKALDNLDSVSINTSLVSDTDSTDNLGSSSIYWANAYLDKIYLDSDSTIEASDVDAWNALVTFPGFTDLATDYGFTDNSSNWDTAYGWGDWSGQGFITGITGESIFDLSDFPADPGADKYLMWDDNPGQLVWADAGVGSGATPALDNLASVAINTSIFSDTADTDDLGSTSKEWANLYIGDAGKIYLGLGQDASINRSAANTMTLTASSGVTTSAGLTVTGTLNGAAINGTIITGDQLISDAASDTAATCGLIDFRKSRDGDPTDSVSDNDYLGELRFRGYHTAGYHEGAIIRAVVNGTPGDGDMPTELIFATSADASATPTTRLTIDATGLATFANGIAGDLTGNVTGDVSGNAGTATTATTANAGDSATAFFSSGTIEHEYGGLEADVSAYAGLVKIASGTTSAVTLGIADTNVAPINAADVADNDYAKFTATGLEGKSYSEVLSDIGAEAADANIIKAAEIDTFAELDAIVADKALVNKADGAVWLGVHDYGGATSFEIPNSATVTDPAVAGQVAIDTTTGQFLYHDGTAQRVMVYNQRKCFGWFDPADADDDVEVWIFKEAATVTNISCRVSGGTSLAVVGGDGTNSFESITCDADGATDDGSITNATFTAGEVLELDCGAPSGTVPGFLYCIDYTITPD